MNNKKSASKGRASGSPKKSASKGRTSGSPKDRNTGQTNKSDAQPTCGGSATCTCRRTQQQLENDPKGGKYARVEKEKPAAVKKKGGSVYPKNTVLWTVHFDAEKDKWVCSDCMHPISDHPQAAEASPIRGRPTSRGSGSPRRNSTTQSRQNAGNSAGWVCEFTGVSQTGTDGCHIIPRNKTDGLAILREKTGDPHVASIDDPRNMLFFTKTLHAYVDALELSFEHISGTNFRVHDWTGQVAKLAASFQGTMPSTVQLRANKNVLMWHHRKCIAENSAEPTGKSAKGRGGGNHDAGKGGGRGRGTGSGRGGASGKKHNRADVNKGEELPTKKKANEAVLTMTKVGLHNASLPYPDPYGASTVSSWITSEY